MSTISLVETRGLLVATKNLMAKKAKASANSRYADKDRPIAVRLKKARVEAGFRTQGALAEAVGMKQQGIGEIEAGRVARPDKLQEIAKAVRRRPEWLLGEGSADETMLLTNVMQGWVELSEAGSLPQIIDLPQPNAGDAVALTMPRDRLPVLGQGEAGPNGRFAMNGERVADVACIPQLVGVKGAYVLSVYGSSMEPRYFHREGVYVNPTLPVAPYDFVVAQIKPAKRGAVPDGYIKQLVKWNAEELILRQFNPELELRFAASKVYKVHYIVLGGRV